MATYDIVTKSVEPIRVAQVRGVAHGMTELSPTLERFFDQAVDYIAQHGATSKGAAITVYYHFGDPDISVGACMPFTGDLQGDEQVEVTDLPAIETVASTIHHGSFSMLPQAYDAIVKWIETNHYRVSGPTRELNLQYERGGDQQNFITEVQFPIEKV